MRQASLAHKHTGDAGAITVNNNLLLPSWHLNLQMSHKNLAVKLRRAPATNLSGGEMYTPQNPNTPLGLLLTPYFSQALQKALHK
jgi:hypothetical protein